MTLSTNRYARQTMLPEIGEDGQLRLTQSRVLIVGVGGLGSPVAIYLAGAGIGIIGLIDADVVNETNLHRQVLYEQTHIGLPKAEMAARRLKAINPECHIKSYTCMLDDTNSTEIINDYDLVIDCSDNYTTRFTIDDACHKLKKPWIHGSIGQFKGMVTVFTPDSGVRYTTLFPERDELCNKPRLTEGVIGPVPGVVGSIQACEAIKIITGISDTLAGRLFTIDLLTLNTNIIEL